MTKKKKGKSVVALVRLIHLKEGLVFLLISFQTFMEQQREFLKSRPFHTAMQTKYDRKVPLPSWWSNAWPCFTFFHYERASYQPISSQMISGIYGNGSNATFPYHVCDVLPLKINGQTLWLPLLTGVVLS